MESVDILRDAPPVRAKKTPDRCPPPWKLDSRVKGKEYRYVYML